MTIDGIGDRGYPKPGLHIQVSYTDKTHCVLLGDKPDANRVSARHKGCAMQQDQQQAVCTRR